MILGQEGFLECLGASREVGRSAFLLATDQKVMIDYGVKLFDESGSATYPLDINVKPDFAVLSHAHMDHSGALPYLYRDNSVPWYGTAPTKDICDVLWQDSMKIMGDALPFDSTHFKKALKHFLPASYGKSIRVGETEFMLHDAGHIAGSAMIEFLYDCKRIVYTGDFKCEDTFMHKGAKPIKDVDVLIIESTYAKREHPKRKEIDYKLMDEIELTVEDGGSALLPAFALGRTQELISTIRHYNKEIPIFVDGMGRTISDIYLNYPSYLRDAASFKKDVRSVTMVRTPADKKAALNTPGVIITSAGMVNGGPVLNYLFNVNPDSKIIFTGYCVKDTNGWKLQNGGNITIEEQDLAVDLPVEYLDFSAHAGRADILNFIKAANPEKIVLVHGEHPEVFMQELKNDFGYDAVAPAIGERVVLD